MINVNTNFTFPKKEKNTPENEIIGSVTVNCPRAGYLTHEGNHFILVFRGLFRQIPEQYGTLLYDQVMTCPIPRIFRNKASFDPYD